MRPAVLVILLAAGASLVASHRSRLHEPSSQSPDAGLASRQLGFQLLSSADAEQIRAGIATLTAAAEGGEIEAAVSLGRIYFHGIPGVARDPARARAWFDEADAVNHPSAAYYLGVMSQRGEGSPPDPTTAMKWFDKAAHSGSAQAMFLLANAYRSGSGVARDDARAVKLYEQAAESEHAPALQALALAYQHGELGLAPDEAESRRYAMEAEHAIKHHREDFP